MSLFFTWAQPSTRTVFPTSLQGPDMQFSLGQTSVTKTAQSKVVSGFHDTGS